VANPSSSSTQKPFAPDPAEQKRRQARATLKQLKAALAPATKKTKLY